MSSHESEKRGIRLRLPATSANVGPGFDAVGLALSMWLTVEAHVSATWQIEATGRNAEVVGALDGNLMVDVYRSVIDEMGLESSCLRLRIHNEIPLGMGWGSSAAAICAGVALGAHFGALGWSDAEIVREAAEREGHPDNVAACWYGGFTASALTEKNGLATATFAGDPAWQMVLVMPGEGLATKKARAMLPESYSREDAVFNVQRAALLTAAFAQGRLDLLRIAMQDRIHQPFRMKACGLLEKLLPLGEEREIAGVALSGAGPSVLVVLAAETTLLGAETRLRQVVGEAVELVPVRIAGGVEREVL
ncbi:MAG TPA: homoserine kinase [Acidobacteriaceae bacterium]|nr:homoserine kinase [Acidobacteriaceae bacterium]